MDIGYRIYKDVSKTFLQDQDLTILMKKRCPLQLVERARFTVPTYWLHRD